MFLIDLTDHRVICIIIGISIAFVSLISIFIRYLIGHHKRQKEKD